jgi:hypothetical protein
MQSFNEKSLVNQGLGECRAQSLQVIAIQKLWLIISLDESSVLELRALWPKGVPDRRPPRTKLFRAEDHAGTADLRAAFERQALALNAQGYNIYVVMNPIRADLVGSGSAKDTDIQHRQLLLVDIDRIGDTSSPANQAELDAAKALALEVRAYLQNRNWSPPILMLSGNGYHLYYRLNQLPNDKASAELICTTLKQLALKFSNQIVGIDTTVYNASRITKVPGTLMRKGLATEDRPYRMAEVCDEQ